MSLVKTAVTIPSAIVKQFKALINKRVEHWLNKRIPTADSVTLHRGNTFIFPSRFGLMFLATCIVLFLIGTNYQNNLILFLVFFLLSFMVTCLLFSYQNLSGLSLTSIASDDQFVDDDCAFVLRTSSKNESKSASSKSHHSKINSSQSIRSQPLNAEPNSAQQVNYVFKPAHCTIKPVVAEQKVTLFSKGKHRGWFKPGRVTVQSNYPFGLFKVWSHLDFGFSCLLYPAPIENTLSVIELSGQQTAVGEQASKAGFDSFSTLKPFQQGDSLKSIAWKQVAQGRGTFTKQFEEEQGGDVTLSLSAFSGVPTEQRLGMLVYQVLSYERQGVGYALDLGYSVIKLGSGAAHQKQCLRALALYGVKDV